MCNRDVRIAGGRDQRDEHDWMLDRAWLLMPAQAFVAEMLQSLVEFPPSQKPASFTIEQVMAKLEAGITSA